MLCVSNVKAPRARLHCNCTVKPHFSTHRQPGRPAKRENNALLIKSRGCVCQLRFRLRISFLLLLLDTRETPPANGKKMWGMVCMRVRSLCFAAGMAVFVPSPSCFFFALCFVFCSHRASFPPFCLPCH